MSKQNTLTKQDYQKSLKHLNTTIDEARIVQPKAIGMLNEIQTQVSQILDRPGDLTFGHHFELMTILKKNVTKFEIKHPGLVTAMENVINTLSNMGI